MIICSNEDEKDCHMIANLHAYQRTTPNNTSQLRNYLMRKYREPNHVQLGVSPLVETDQPAGWIVDFEE